MTDWLALRRAADHSNWESEHEAVEGRPPTVSLRNSDQQVWLRLHETCCIEYLFDTVAFEHTVNQYYVCLWAILGYIVERASNSSSVNILCT